MPSAPASGGDAPREYPAYVPGYYAVFFSDPDGIKLEGGLFARCPLRRCGRAGLRAAPQ
jgi:hypothetical protein